MTDIRAWLEDLGLGRYAEAFAENDVDAAVLPELTGDDLKEIGVQSVGHRRKLLAAIAGLAPDEQPVTAPPSPEAEPEPAGEYRQVTVLFADLVGFTRLSGELGAEQTHKLLNRYFEVLDAVVAGYGGHVDKHIGDNVMAVFGAPTAHSNDPERAVRAALDMHEAMAGLTEELGQDLKVHVGVASGQVVASHTGSDTHREYTVTGDSVNLASRLQDAAGAGTTLVSNAVHGAVSDLIECTPAGEIEVKGFETPIRVWRLAAIREQAAAGAAGRLVGRENERRQFTALLDECLESGTGQTILVRGEAGIGKTRLMREFQAVAEGRGFAAHGARALDFGAGKGQDPVRGLVRSFLGIAAPTAKAAADRAVADGLLDDGQRVFLNDLLDLPQPTDLRTLYDAMDNATRNTGKLTVVTHLVETGSRSRPLFVAVEDVHWADEFTLATLTRLAVAVSAHPVVLVATTRIEGDPLDRAWRSTLRGSPLTTIDLGPLRPADALEIAGTGSGPDDRFLQACVERSGGNPLFLEQLLRNAAECGETEVPGSIQSLVQARMDRLETPDRLALQAASVIGQRFSLEVLRHLIGDAGYDCAALLADQLVSPEGADYLFTHALIRDAVYASLLKVQKCALHDRAGAWFEERDPVLHAEHLDRAESEKAPAAYLEAARRQAAAYRYERAIRLADRGITLAEDTGDRFELSFLRAEILRELGRPKDALEVFRSLPDLATDELSRCRSWIGMASCGRLLGSLGEAGDALDRAEPVAQRLGAFQELSQVHYYRGCLLFAAGDVEGCLEQQQGALDAAVRARDPECEARALSGLGDACYGQGRMRLAVEHFVRCRALCRRHGFGRIEVGGNHMIAVTRRYLNAFGEAIDELRAAIGMAASVGNARTEMVANLILGEFQVDQDDLKGAYAALERALRFADGFGNPRYHAYARYELGRALWHDPQRRHEAETRLDEALQFCRESDMAFISPRVLAAKALVSAHERDRRAALDEGEAILRSGCLSHVGLWFYRDAMEACLAAHDWDGVERYAAALAEHTTAERLPWSDFFMARGRALAAFGRGRRDEATMGELERLRDEAEQVGLRAALPALRQALAAA